MPVVIVIVHFDVERFGLHLYNTYIKFALMKRKYHPVAKKNMFSMVNRQN